MRIDPLQQYARLKQQLMEEKARIEARLNEINRVLGTDATAESGTTTKVATTGVARIGRGRRGRNQMSMREAIAKALKERGPLGRKELGEAIQDVGYVSNAKNLLNSMGIILYARNSPFKKKDGKFYLPESASGIDSSAENGNSGKAAIKKKKRKMSAEGRRRIAAAQKARWAKLKASK
jgi:hypothetical protein